MNYNRIISKLLIWIVSFFLFFSNTASANPLLGTWGASDGSFNFAADGSFKMTMNGQKTTGIWAASGNNILQIQTFQGVFQYYAMLQGDILVLQDANGYLYQLQKQDSSVPPVKTAQKSAVGEQMTDTQFVSFLKEYPTLTPDQVFEKGKRFSPSQKQMLTVYQAIGFHIYTTMCSGTYPQEVVYDSLNGGLGCTHLIRQAQLDAQAQAFAGVSTGSSYANTQRIELITVFSCSAGLVDKASCGSYQQGQQMLNQSTMQNTKTASEVYQCTEYYDTVTGQFLYCL